MKHPRALMGGGPFNCFRRCPWFLLLSLLVGGLWLNAAVWLARGARLRRRAALVAPDASAALRLGGCAEAGAGAALAPASFAPQLVAPPAEAAELCFVVRVMPAHLPNLPALVFSAAGSPAALRLRFIFVRTYTPASDDGLEASVAFLNAALQPLRASGGEPPASVAPIDGSYTEAHFPGLRDATYAGDAGYVVTDVVLEGVLARRAAAGGGGGGGGFCDALVVTNGDNLYTSSFVPAVAAALREGSELVGVHFVSRYNYTEKVRDGNWRAGHGPLRTGADVEYSPRFVPYGIDLGAVVFTAELLRRGGTLFALDRLRADPAGRGVDFISADGRFFEALQAEAAAPVIIPRVLYVHQ
jgi:hypothetical protein